MQYNTRVMSRISEELKQLIEEDGMEKDRTVSYIIRKILEKHYAQQLKQSAAHENTE